jgi:hypothetical protein
MKLIKITSVTVHPPTAAARAAVAPLIKHLTSLTSQQLLALAARARAHVRRKAQRAAQPAKCPLRKVIRAVPDTAGKRLYLVLECNHIIQKPLKATLIQAGDAWHAFAGPGSRVRCKECA